MAENKIAKIFTGVVVSDRMPKTRVVEIKNYIKVPKYQKYVKNSKRFKVHDENNEYKIGDRVKISETRPISRDKHWKIISKI